MSLGNITTQQGKFRVIADKIRNCTGETEIILPNDFDDKIDDVYEAGKKAAYDAFWDMFQNKGNRRKYNFAFFSAEGLWTDESFKPKYDIVMQGGSDDAFYGLSKITKFKKGFYGEEDLQIDTSEMTSANWLCFNMSSLIELPLLDFSKVIASVGAFSGCSSLTKLHLTVSENTVFAAMSSGTFAGCKSLTDLKITGTIGKDIGIPGCTALSADTIYTQIILNLKDYSADTSGTTHTLNLGATNLAKLTEAQISAATEKGWVVV